MEKLASLHEMWTVELGLQKRKHEDKNENIWGLTKIYQLIRINGRLGIKVVHAKPHFGNVKILSICQIVNWSRDIRINDVGEENDADIMEVYICKGKYNLKECGRSFVPNRNIRGWGGNLWHPQESMRVWTFGLAFDWVRPTPTCSAKMQRKMNEKIAMRNHIMNGRTRKCHTHLAKELLDAVVGWRGNLGPHEILNEFLHVQILNQRERWCHLWRSGGCIRCDRLPLARHGGAATWSKEGEEGVAVGILTTVVLEQQCSESMLWLRNKWMLE